MEEINEEIRAKRLKNQDRAERVYKYLGGDSVKQNTFNIFTDKVDYGTNSDKITLNNYKSTMNNTSMATEGKKYLKNSNHVIIGGKGFYV
jgi:hypothetical protein